MKKTTYQNLPSFLSSFRQKGLGSLPAVFAVADPVERRYLIQELSAHLTSPQLVTIENLEKEAGAFSLFSEGDYITEFDDEIDPSHLTRICSSTVRAVLITNKCPDLKCDVPVVEISTPKPWERVKRIATLLQLFFEQKGKKMAHDAAQALSESLATAAVDILNESEKLLLYVNDRKDVSIDDVRAICTLKDSATVWNFWNAFSAGEKSKTLSSLDVLINDDMHPLQIVRFLRTQLSQAIKFVENPSETGPSQFKNEALAKLQSRYGIQKLRSMYVEVDELEFRLKNSEGDSKLLLELFLVTHIK